VLRTTLLTVLLAAASASAQQAQPLATPPQLRLNMVNSCTPAEAEKGEIAAALARIPEKPEFAPDFEIARGRTTGKDGVADWVRLRRDFAASATMTSVQFNMDMAGGKIDETLVLHLKAGKLGEPLQISLEQEVTAGTPADMLRVNTPPNRIRLERFGKPSLILARCPNVDQSAYEPLFRMAAERSAAYNAALDVRGTVPAELERLKPAKRK
jgi:hypothetical protein